MTGLREERPPGTLNGFSRVGAFHRHRTQKDRSKECVAQKQNRADECERHGNDVENGADHIKNGKIEGDSDHGEQACKEDHDHEWKQDRADESTDVRPREFKAIPRRRFSSESGIEGVQSCDGSSEQCEEKSDHEREQ